MISRACQTSGIALKAASKHIISTAQRIAAKRPSFAFPGLLVDGLGPMPRRSGTTDLPLHGGRVSGLAGGAHGQARRDRVPLMIGVIRAAYHLWCESSRSTPLPDKEIGAALNELFSSVGYCSMARAPMQPLSASIGGTNSCCRCKEPQCPDHPHHAVHSGFVPWHVRDAHLVPRTVLFEWELCAGLFRAASRMVASNTASSHRTSE